MHNSIELLSDIVLKALLAKWSESQLQNSDVIEFRKLLWLQYLLVTGLEIALTIHVAYVHRQSAKNASSWSRTAVGLENFIQTSGCGFNRPLWTLVYNCKKLHEFFDEYFCYLFGVCNNQINKSQKISTCYVKYVLFILEKTKQKGSIDFFGPSRVKNGERAANL